MNTSHQILTNATPAPETTPKPEFRPEPKQEATPVPVPVSGPTSDESKLEGQELMDAIRRRRKAEAYRTDMAAVIAVLKRRDYGL